MGIEGNPTQYVGIASYGLAALACAWTARVRASPWRGLAIINVLAALEIAVGGRWVLHDWVDSLLQGQEWYARRGLLQWPLLLIGGLLLCVGLAIGWRRFNRLEGATGLAVLASFCTVTVFFVELVSLHATDALLYEHLGPFMHIALIWALAAAMTFGGALMVRFGRDP